ncbi:MAG TPA: anhydro-N-acetylmuramic acid kinase [Chitinophagaceae bacterium]|nr:anhydro-N-acetylmuramic acid kinase [Chitinophagaceae bacterium]
MVYRVIGLMSGSSLDGLDIAFVEFQETAGEWRYEIIQAACYPYDDIWKKQLEEAPLLSAKEYQLLHTDYGHYLGQRVNQFIEEHQIQYQAALISSHGHTTFHMPERKMTGQIGEGAAIAAETALPVVTDLRSLDIALGGQGAPIVPIGEKLLLKEYDYFLNIGGIANISHNREKYTAFDVCPANRVMNLLAKDAGKEYDEKGQMAASGKINKELLEKLNTLDYYRQPFPKSLANDFGTGIVYPLIKSAGLSIPDSLATYAEHITIQTGNALAAIKEPQLCTENLKMLVTGGGAYNEWLIGSLRKTLGLRQVDIVVPDSLLIDYKEAMVMAFIGVLRWRQEYNVLSSVTGSSRDNIGGALWTGQEA